MRTYPTRSRLARFVTWLEIDSPSWLGFSTEMLMAAALVCGYSSGLAALVSTADDHTPVACSSHH